MNHEEQHSKGKWDNQVRLALQKLQETESQILLLEEWLSGLMAAYEVQLALYDLFCRLADDDEPP